MSIKDQFMQMNNTNNIIMTISKFMYDIYNIKVFELIKEPELSNMTRSVFIQVRDENDGTNGNNGSNYSIEHLNKRAMSILKETILSYNENIVKRQEKEKEKQEKEKEKQENKLNHDNFDIGNQFETALEEDEFLKRMKILEEGRKDMNLTQVEIVKPDKPFFPPTGVTTNAKTELFITKTIVQQPQQTPSVTNVININSWARNATFSPSRNSFIWAGPILSSIKSLTIKSLMVPSNLITPYIIMEIQGLGGQINHIHFIKSNSTNSTDIWDKYTSIQPEILPLGCPWTIRLFDAFTNPLSLGDDNVNVTAITNNILTVNDIGDLHQDSLIMLGGITSNILKINRQANTFIIETSTNYQHLLKHYSNLTIINLNKQTSIILSYNSD